MDIPMFFDNIMIGECYAIRFNITCAVVKIQRKRNG